MTRVGLFGDWVGTCVVCGNDTESAISLKGSREWVLETLVELGATPEAATALLGDEVVPICPGHAHPYSANPVVGGVFVYTADWPGFRR